MRWNPIIFLALLLSACNSSPTTVLDYSAAIENPRFGDTDPVAWAGTKPWQYPVHGIDVSKYQGHVDWYRVKSSGVAFAFIKATEGADWTDPKFEQNWRNAKAVGMPRGAYHFYYFCRSAIEQARWFIRNVPVDQQAMPPVLDMEWNHHSKTCKRRPNRKVVLSEMRIFLSELEKHYKRRPLIYTTVDFYKKNELWRIHDHEFWLRSVANHPSQVYPGQPWAFWQYTGTGQVPGINAETDINVFAGSPDDWRSWLQARVN